MKRLFTIILAALLLIAAVGCVKEATANTYTSANGAAPAGNTEATQTETNTNPEPAAPAGNTEATQTETNTNPEPAAPAGEDNTPEEDSTVGEYPIATITMKDGGVMKLELYPDVAPNTVKNFISLANSGFYDGLTFHRVIPGFMIQGGDPNGNGTGGPGYSIKGEFSGNGFTNNLSHKRGVLSMARAYMPDSAGSQFFIMHADYPYLDGQYAAFGMLLEGFTVLDKIAMTKTDSNDKPLTPVEIDTIRVETFGVDYGEPEKIQ